MEPQNKTQIETHSEPSLIWPILVALALGIALIVGSGYLKPRYEKVSEVVLEIGIGFVTGAVIGATLENYMRKQDQKHLKDIETRVFYALFGTALPDSLVKSMYEMLFKRRFVRQKLTITIKLRPLTDLETQKIKNGAKDLLVLTQTVSYDALNVSRDKETHQVAPQEFILIPHPDFTQPFCNFTATPAKGNAVITDIQSRFSRAPDNIWYHLKTQDVHVAPGEKLHVVSEVQLVCRDTDMRTWLTYYPADGMTLKVELHPELIGQIEFAVDQSNHDALIPDFDPKVSGNRRVYGWELNAPILPFQGLALIWRRRPGASSSGGDAPRA